MVEPVPHEVLTFAEVRHALTYVIGGLVSFIAMLGLGRVRALEQRIMSLESDYVSKERFRKMEQDVSEVTHKLEHVRLEVAETKILGKQVAEQVNELHHTLLHKPDPRTII